MNTRDHNPQEAPVGLPDVVKTELLRRRDAVDAGEPTIGLDKAFEELQRRARERQSKPSPR